MREWLPRAFGYQGCGVLIYDKQSDVLFADPDFTHATKEQLAKLMVKKEVESSEDEDLEVGLSNNLK